MSRYWSEVAKSLTPYVPGEQPKLRQSRQAQHQREPLRPVAEGTGRDPRARPATTCASIPDPRGSTAARRPSPPASATSSQRRSSSATVPTKCSPTSSWRCSSTSGRSCFRTSPTASIRSIAASTASPTRRCRSTESFEIRAEDYLRANGGIIFPNPNAPTGRALPLADIERIVAGNPDSVVVIDEAYVDFGAESAVSLVNRHPNLLVVQTLSKSRSLAGLRVGFAVGHADLIEALERVKDSFNSYPLDRLAHRRRRAAIEDREWFERTRQAVITSRAKLSARPGSTRFRGPAVGRQFRLRPPPAARRRRTGAALRERSIIVRHFTQPRIDQFLRITVGTDEQCAALVAALKEILSA